MNIGDPRAATVHDVIVIDWPEQQSLRLDLADRGVLRLLRIGVGVDAPLVIDDAEDWIRVPCSDDDVRARIRTLSQRAMTQRETAKAAPAPRVDQHDLLRVGSRLCVLAPVEAALLRVLLADLGEVTGRDVLMTVGWPDGTGSRNALDLRMMRLRRKVEPMGVMLRTVRNRGYLIETEFNP